MNDEIGKIFEKHPELAEEAAELGFKIMPTVIEALLLSGKIDKSRIDDWEYGNCSHKIWLKQERQDRRSHQPDQFLKGVLAIAFCSVQDSG